MFEEAKTGVTRHDLTVAENVAGTGLDGHVSNRRWKA
jgi:hypothetical protein